MLRKDEAIEDLNELLDTLSPQRAREIFQKLPYRDLLDLEAAIEVAISEARNQENNA